MRSSRGRTCDVACEGKERDQTRPVRFRPRVPDLDPLDAASVARWSAKSDESLGPGLTAEQRRALAALLVEVWANEYPSESYVDDPSDLAPIEHLPDFVPAPTYEWGHALHHESGLVFEWTVPDPEAEVATMMPIDPYEPLALVDVEERENEVFITFQDGLGDGADVWIRTHHIDLFETDEHPQCLVHAIQAFTGWAAERPERWMEPNDGVHLVGVLLPCSSCGELGETGQPYTFACEHCGGSRVGLTVRA